MEDIIRTFDSWDVYGNKVAVKNCDKSFFVHHGSGVPINVRWYFNVEHLNPGEKKNIVLVFENTNYKAYISKESTSSERTRIFWHSDLSIIFNNILKISANGYPSLRFERIKQNTYSISFINLYTIVDEDNDSLENTIVISEGKEGKKIARYVTIYERNSNNRKNAIKVHGTKCIACGFDFEKKYGEYGKDFIEVHHVKPLFGFNEEVLINPITDLVCLCSNCHRMVHLKRDHVLSIEELKQIIIKQKTPFNNV